MVAGTAGAFAYAVLLLAGGGPQALEAALFALAVAGAAAACAAHAAAHPRTRLPWLLLMGAILFYGGNATAYAVIPAVAARFPSIYDLGLLGFYPLAAAAFAVFVRREGARFSGVLWIDSVLGALLFAAVGGAAAWPVVAPPAEPAVGGQLLFFLGDLGLLGFLLATYTLSGWHATSSVTFFAGGAALLALADGAFVVNVADGAGDPRPLSTIAWAFALLLLAAAPRRAASRGDVSSRVWAKVGIPAVCAAGCLPIVLFAPPTTPHGIIATTAVGLVVLRLTLSLLANSRLVASISAAAITDPLTGLPNRQLLVDRIDRALVRQSRHERLLAVMLVDLDEFKGINVTHGHDFGDRVLVAVAERIHAVLRGEDTISSHDAPTAGDRTGDTVGRIGSDEFVVLIQEIEDATAAGVVAERILAELRAGVAIDGRRVPLEASIGVTVVSTAAEQDAPDLLRDADVAVRAAKRSGGGRFELFEAEMHQEVVRRAALVGDLRRAIDEQQLRLLFQPQVDVSTGRMTGVEALVRWEHHEHGLLGPHEFIPVAEATGLIVAIDNWVLREACRQLRAWDEAGMPPLDMAVNVSALRLTAGDLAADVETVLREIGIEPQRLEIELTETVAVREGGEAAAAIERVRRLGTRAAIDDFGMGHSALSRLQSFPVDRLKIDRSFIAPLSREHAHGSIADAMVAIGQSLGLEVVAEGVETREQLDAIRRLGCPTAQGYLFSRPVPAATIARYARAGSRLSPLERDGDGPVTPEAAKQERLTRNLLAELQRTTGLETTYLTRIDWHDALQHITHSRNTGAIDVPEGLVVDWSDTVCRRALEQGVAYTDEVPVTFGDSAAARDLGLQTYISVPVVNDAGEIEGTLCGASSRRVKLGPDALGLMERFAQIIARGVASNAKRRARAAERS